MIADNLGIFIPLYLIVLGIPGFIIMGRWVWSFYETPDASVLFGACLAGIAGMILAPLVIVSAPIIHTFSNRSTILKVGDRLFLYKHND